MAFSRVKTVVHPDYARFEDFVRRLPQENFPIDRVFCDRRNTVVATHDQGMAMVVKKYARPTLFNCFVYTFFRPSKAERAYRYALRLARCGVETAAPIGYVHVYRGGIFHTGYFLCRFLPYPTLSSIKKLDETEKRQLGEDFVAFTVFLHRHGLVPGDYNPGNILYHKDSEGKYRFALVDQPVLFRASYYGSLHAVVYATLRSPSFTVGRSYPTVLRRSALGSEARLEIFPALSPFALPEGTYKIQVQIASGFTALKRGRVLISEKTR